LNLGVLRMLALLLACQLAGETVSRATNLPVPGPVLGLVLVFAGLLWLKRVPEPLERTSRGLLDNLSLLFVPAGVGIVQHLDILRAQWLPIAAAILGSTLLTMWVTAAAMLATEALLARGTRAKLPGEA
jgi:putative effector of murein hydrolase LrgA (UPF0299 family)